ncbi:MAG: anaerobic sulfatase maturase [Ferrimicrobium sp.]
MTADIADAHDGMASSSLREPFAVMVKPTGPICNLDCGYCYYLDAVKLFNSSERFRASEAVLETYIRANIEQSPGPVVYFSWHGGEPTLVGIEFYQRIIELQKKHLPSSWTASNNIQTNATLLNERWCQFLAANHFTVGISIDGPAALHDTLRRDKGGRGSHARVIRGLRLLRAHGIEPDVLCTLNSITAQHPLSVYRFFREQNVTWLQFLPVVKCSSDGKIDPLSVDPTMMGTFLCTVFDEWVRHDVATIGVQNFLESLLVWSGQRANLCTMTETCGRVLAMEHDGSVYSCDHFVDREHLLGTIDDGLSTLLDSPKQRAFGRAKRDHLSTACKECPVLFACNGGCPKDRLAFTQDGEDRQNYLCSGYRRFFEHIDPYMRHMVALARRGVPIVRIMTEIAAQDTQTRKNRPSLGRNDPCHCGSGIKYKNCCWLGHKSSQQTL